MTDKKRAVGFSKSSYPGIRRYTKKDGSTTWSFRYYDPGEKKTIWGESFDSAEEARDARASAIVASRKSSHRKGNVRLSFYIDQWPESHAGNRKSTTLLTYKQGIRAFRKEFGDVKVRKFSQDECRDWARKQKRSALAPARAMLTDLWKDGKVPHNWLRDVTLPPEPGRRNYPVLTTEEVWELIELSREVLRPNIGPQVAGLIATAAFLGTRLGETLALGSESLDFEKGEVLVSKQIGKSNSFRDPKNGERKSGLSEYLQNAWQKLDLDVSGNPLFKPSSAAYFTPTNFYRSFERVVSASGIPGLTFHELRHHHQTWLTVLNIEAWAINAHIGHGRPNGQMSGLYTHAEDHAPAEINKFLTADVAPLEPKGLSRKDFIPPSHE